MRRGVAAVAGLAVLTAVIGLLTRPLIHSLRADTVTADLGILPAPSERARIVDDHVLDSIEAHAFGSELRLRLDRPASRVNLPPFFIDECEVRQIDFERFAKWHEAEIGTILASNAPAAASAPSVAPDGPPGASATPIAPGRAAGRARGAMDSAPPMAQSGAPAVPTADRPPSPPAVRYMPLASISTGHRIAGLLSSPATGVDFASASLYCAAMGGRLPWAEELEAAASGKEWLSDEFVGDRLGVTTDGQGRLIRLELGSNGLVGSI